MTPAAPASTASSPLVTPALEPLDTGAFRQFLERTTDAAHTGRNSSSGTNDPQELPADRARRRAPTQDPTAAAAAELISPSPVKPAVAEAQAIQSGQGNAKSPASASDGPASARSQRAPSSSQPTAQQTQSSSQHSPIPQTDRANAARPPTESKPQNTPAKPVKAAASTASRAPGAPIATDQPGGKAAPRSAQPLASLVRAGGVRIQGLPRVGAAPAKPAAAAAKAARTATGPARPPREEAVAAQFGRGLAAALRQNGGTVTMRLAPEALGDLKIRLALEPGRVEASFEVQSDQARRLLGTSMDSLRSALEAQGLEVSRLDVRMAEPIAPPDTNPQFGGADAQGGRSSFGSEDPRPGMDDAARTPREVAAEPATDEQRWTGGALRLDALA